jgi:rfaE bifunctional protein nucleotidyltransferase chain/domain
MIVSEPELVAAVARDRAAGKTVAFANGCFDLLHVGHVRYLLGAAAEGDRLVVAVNDDLSVAGLKGEGRPILPASDRAELVAALRGVDYVVVFGDPNVERLLLLLKPDVHCKGTDYTVESVPERSVVAGYGGRTAIVGDAKHHATREILARVARTQDQERTRDHGRTQDLGRTEDRGPRTKDQTTR